MTPERWQRICAVFDSAIEQPVSGVDEYLRTACSDDSGLQEEVRRMLHEHRRSGVLDRTPLGMATAAAGAPPVFHEGQTLAGRYHVLRYLSRGGMGEVYEARDLELGETVALKTLLPAIAADELMIARFKQEIALSRKISHPNVCNVFDLAHHEDERGSRCVFLTMEYLDGGTLSEKLQREGPMSTEQALPILQQVGAALEAAHQAGVIHRDFKPSNVMLVQSETGLRAVVTDFGLARSFVTSGGPADTMSNMLVGTLDYMAPELLTGSTATFASDVYALGMVAYKMVTGSLPFGADTPLAGAILRSHQSVPSPRKLAPQLPDVWEHAILRALDPKPATRLNRARHFLEALRGEAVSMTVKLPVMTRRRVAAAAVVVLAAAGALFGWRAWDNARSRPPAEALSPYRKGVEDLQAGAYFAATKALGKAVEIAPRFSMAHARLAEAWMDLDLPEQANREMVATLRLNNSGLTALEKMQIDAISLRVTRDFEAAAAKYEQLVAEAGGGADSFYLDLGRAYERARNSAKAAEYYQKAAQRTRNPAAWLRLAVLYYRTREWEKSGRAFDEAEALYQQSSNMEGLTAIAFQRGVSASRQLAFDRAATYLQRAMDTARMAGNAYQEIEAKLQMATVSYNAGNTEAAERYAREALDGAQQNGFHQLLIVGLNNLANAYDAKGDSQTAERYFQDALGNARRNNFYRLAATCLFLLASLHDQAHKPDEAAREAGEALAYFQQNRFAAESLQMLIILGRSQRNRGDYKEARATFQNLRDSAVKAKDHDIEATAYEGLGSVSVAQENLPQALQEYGKDLEIARPGQGTGFARLWCGAILGQLGRPKEADSMWAAAEPDAAKFASLQRALREQRANLALSAGNNAEAERLMREAVKEDKGQDVRATSAIHRILGLALLRAGRKPAGLVECEQSLATVGVGYDQSALWQARMAVLEARVGNGRTSEASALFGEMEPALPQHPESGWRALALISRLQPARAVDAAHAFAALDTQWGQADSHSYGTRGDVQKLARPFLQKISAK